MKKQQQKIVAWKERWNNKQTQEKVECKIRNLCEKKLSGRQDLINYNVRIQPA